MRKRKLLYPFLFLFGFVLVTSLACGSSPSSPVVNSPTNISENESTTSEPEVIATTEIKPTNTVEQEPIGTSRSNPAPVGSEISSDDMLFSVTEIIRPADEIVSNGNMFNSTPEPGKEYIFIKLLISCQKSPDDKCSIYPSSFKLINSSGNIVESEFFLSGVTGLLENNDLFGGASVEGYLSFIVEQQEANPILMYEPLIFGDEFYLKILE